jgi:hypothetical protein
MALEFMKLARWAVDNQNGTSAVVGREIATSPSGSLPAAIIGDVFGPDVAEDVTSPVTRDMAMRQPAVVRSRGVLVTLARYPLVAKRKDKELATSPAWLYRTDTPTSPQERMTWLIDDAYFHGRALLIVERDAAGRITDAVRLPSELWRDRPNGDGVDISTGPGQWIELNTPELRKSYIRFQSFQDGFLKIGATVVRTGEGIQRGIAGRARSPIPMIDLHMTEDTGMTAPEKEELRAAWVRARNTPEGAVAITPHNLEAKVLGSGDEEFLNTARNSQRIDVANLSQIPVGLIDGSVSMASLTYSTQEGRRVEFHDYGLNLWRTVFEARLSLDDVTPKGTRLEFDLSELMQVPDEGSGPELED